MSQSCIVHVAVPSPLHASFDYLWPYPQAPQPGMRVRVPFGRRQLIGLVIGSADRPRVGAAKLKTVAALLDPEPVLPPELMRLLRWATGYYHHPPGEVLAAALPSALRQGEPASAPTREYWRLGEAGAGADPNELGAQAHRQRALLMTLRAQPQGVSAAALHSLQPNWRQPMRALQRRGWVEQEQRLGYPLLEPVSRRDVPLALNQEQAAAAQAIAAASDKFGCFLLDGVTGSGKTEVYLTAIAAALAASRQVLVLVPEIGLTPQLIERFSARFALPLAVLHSALSERERLGAWLAARDGAAAIVIGTRSAIFTPLARPGLIILDEEHDSSFKQQEGFRYNARDLALVRAKQLDVPIVLGSATPSLESLENAQRGRYRHLRLRQRAAAAATPPRFRLLDIRGRPLQGGLSEPLLAEIGRHLDGDGQVLVFLNRRGFAPTLLCHECGWIAGCSRCDARLTLHQRSGRLRCHHCAGERPIPHHCPECGSVDLRPVGQGTERVEEALAQRFPEVGLIRIDRDSTRRKGAMGELLAQARRGEGRILLGTQMLAKGHHLPDITLVAIVDADQGLFGADFRAPERMAQLIVQVAGRAGREARAGEVIIQTHHPEHPLLHLLLSEGYARFAREELDQRRLAELPPFSAMALLRAEAVDATLPQQFLLEARQLAQRPGAAGVRLLGPLPAPMERRAGRFRAQLLLQAPERAGLHRLLQHWVPQLGRLPTARRVRWSLDVDPMDTL